MARIFGSSSPLIVVPKLYTGARGLIKPRLPFSPNFNSPQADGLVGWWPHFPDEQANANILRDYIGQRNAIAIGSPTGLAQYVQGIDKMDGIDYSLLDGAGHSIEWSCGTGSLPNLASTGYTYAFWIDANATPGAAVDSGVLNASSGFSFEWDSTGGFVKSAIQILNDGVTVAQAQIQSTLVANTLYHITVVWDLVNLSIYLNGGLEQSTATPSLQFIGGSPLTFANLSGFSALPGRLYDIRLWNKPLPPELIAEMANAGAWDMFYQPKQWHSILTKFPDFTASFTSSTAPSAAFAMDKISVPFTSSVTPSAAVVPDPKIAFSSLVHPTGALAAPVIAGTPQVEFGANVAPAGSLNTNLSGIGFLASVTPSGLLRINSCTFTLYELLVRLYERLDDPGPVVPVYYTKAEAIHALNVTQRLFCLLTLCIERTATFNITNAQAFQAIRAQLSDFLVPLRILFNGTRLLTDTLHSLDMADDTWRNRAGNPLRYAQAGFNGLWITPQPAAGSNTLAVTYAAEPAVLVNDSDSPEIPDEQQIHLPDGAYFILRLKEGGAELQAAVPYLERFLQAAKKYAVYTRARCKGQQYDRKPMDLNLGEISRILLKMSKTPAGRIKPPTQKQQQ